MTVENLMGLGAERLAEILAGVAETRADLKRRLRMELAAEQGPAALTAEIEKPLASFVTGQGQIIWRQRPAFIRDIDALRELIADRLAPPRFRMPLARLSTLEAFDRLGSGLAVSAHDLDLRGAGDLTGEGQAEHMQMIGAALYHRLLDRAIRLAKCETVLDDVSPNIHLGERGLIPAGHVPDAVTRINLDARLAR